MYMLRWRNQVGCIMVGPKAVKACESEESRYGMYICAICVYEHTNMHPIVGSMYLLVHGLVYTVVRLSQRHVCTHVCTHTRAHTHAHTHTHTHTRTHAHAHAHTHTHTHTHTRAHTSYNRRSKLVRLHPFVRQQPTLTNSH